MNVSIVDDTILENVVETIEVILESTPGLNSNITLDPVNGVVEITDNDGRYDDCMVVTHGVTKAHSNSYLQSCLLGNT